MATGQSVLNLMEVLSPELQMQSGEQDVTKGLLALNAAQDIFETLCAQHPQIFGSQVGTLMTTALQEYTTFPTGLIRIDGLDFLDATNLLPIYPIENSRTRGGHRYGRPWWWAYAFSGVATGQPKIYWTNGTRIYWDPIPADVYSIRYYGFVTASDITAGGPFAYPDAAMLPLAAVATKIIKVGLDDPAGDISSLAKDILNPYIDALSDFNRDASHSLQYAYSHDT